MSTAIDEIRKRISKLEARNNAHWALQTEDDFVNQYIDRAKIEFQRTIIRIAIAAFVLLGGAGAVFVEHSIHKTFKNQNAQLVKELQDSYTNRIALTNNNFEWRRFHDYGKDYVNLAKLYNEVELPIAEKKVKILDLLKEAEKYFKDALSHGDMHASTYWERGELLYGYPLEFGFIDNVNRLKAIEMYKAAAKRYTLVEIAKGWRAEAYLRIGTVYWELAQSNQNRDEFSDFRKRSLKHLNMASDGYAENPHLTDDRSKANIDKIIDLTSAVEGQREPKQN